MRGLGTTRTGRPLIGLQTLIDSFRKKAADVSVGQALDATRTLGVDARTRTQKYRDNALVGGALNPVVRGIGRAVEAGVATPGSGKVRLARAARAAFKPKPGEFARQVVEGGLGGSMIRAAQEGTEIHRAKSTLNRFLGETNTEIK